MIPNKNGLLKYLDSLIHGATVCLVGSGAEHTPGIALERMPEQEQKLWLQRAARLLKHVENKNGEDPDLSRIHLYLLNLIYHRGSRRENLIALQQVVAQAILNEPALTPDEMLEELRRREVTCQSRNGALDAVQLFMFLDRDVNGGPVCRVEDSENRRFDLVTDGKARTAFTPERLNIYAALIDRALAENLTPQENLLKLRDMLKAALEEGKPSW